MGRASRAACATTKGWGEPVRDILIVGRSLVGLLFPARAAFVDGEPPVIFESVYWGIFGSFEMRVAVPGRADS